MSKNAGRGSSGLRVFLLTLALSLIMGGSAALAAGPADDIKSLINEVQGYSRQSGPSRRRPASPKVDLVEQAAARHFNYREMAKRSLGETWDTLSQGQQNEFVKNFSGLLRPPLPAAWTNSQGQGDLSTGNPQTRPRRGAHHHPAPQRQDSRQLSDAQGTPGLDDLRPADRRVSLADNYRGQFARVIQGGSFKDLLKSSKPGWPRSASNTKEQSKKLFFVILSAAKNLSLKLLRFFTPLRSVQNDMNIIGF